MGQRENNDKGDSKTEQVIREAEEQRARARAAVDKGKELADKGKELAGKGKQLAGKGKQLADKVQLMVSTVLNLFTSVAVVISVVLGTKNIDVSKEQLGLATQQIETSKEIAKSVSDRGGERGEAWEAALEAMLIDQAVANEEPALIRSFLPPGQLAVGAAPKPVKISLQSLSGARLNGQIEGEIVGDMGQLCQLPGCLEANDSSCTCQDPIRYNFVLPPMHERVLELPIMLTELDAGQCRRHVEVVYTIKIQDARGNLQRLARREVRYQREDRDCSAGAIFESAHDDSWEGEPAGDSGAETEGAPDEDTEGLPADEDETEADAEADATGASDEPAAPADG